MTIYDKAPDEVFILVNEVKAQYHPDLVEAGATIDVLFAFNDKGSPVTGGGYPAFAVIRNITLKNRVKGMADAEITIDGEVYKNMSDEQRRALVDHELYHLIVKRDKEGNIQFDDADRPKFKMRKHDYQMGWFRAIAVRHGRNSPEVYQAGLLMQQDGNVFFPPAYETPALTVQETIDRLDKILDEV